MPESVLCVGAPDNASGQNRMKMEVSASVEKLHKNELAVTVSKESYRYV